MQQNFILGLLMLIALSTLGIYFPLRAFIRTKRAKMKFRVRPKKGILIRNISLLVVSVPVWLGSVYWFMDCYAIEGPPYSFSIEDAIDLYGDFEDYIVLDRIDVEYSNQPIVIVQENNSLYICDPRTRKMLIGLEKYYISGAYTIVDGKMRFGYLIDENQVHGGSILSFPNLWFGIIYPDKRDHIRINGKVPTFHDIHFNGVDYVLWYIEKDAEKAVLTFEG